ncbi:uncharacterized protein B0I36DRAFT_337287 [Microdochium trichocladiopsis]|uniref:Uncharacterized protein n=1 Tax=Microdochium trichocladiopsis TaxID=1682393 RepID=A0A9P8XTL6_9PEZI|nr:uncharacterized protein B0I36DRAFT_337287 [Microdochium trichocladiopsis]KAH7016308.1 hypothetical protein B0I36DRAFT_337287 [Microdochium trichocladiopsis]
MEGSIIDFDPDGDLILTLRNPDAPFAVWPEDGDCHLDLQQSFAPYYGTLGDRNSSLTTFLSFR